MCQNITRLTRDKVQLVLDRPSFTWEDYHWQHIWPILHRNMNRLLRDQESKIKMNVGSLDFSAQIGDQGGYWNFWGNLDWSLRGEDSKSESWRKSRREMTQTELDARGAGRAFVQGYTPRVREAFCLTGLLLCVEPFSESETVSKLVQDPRQTIRGL